MHNEHNGFENQMRVRVLKKNTILLTFKNADARIRSFLTELASDFGKLTDNGYEIKNFLTHSDIAKLTATSRQTVSSTLNELRDQKLIANNKHLILIPTSSNLFKNKPV